MELIFCGKRVARAVLVVYKYCPYFFNFVEICSNLVLMWKPLCFCPANHQIVSLMLRWSLEMAKGKYTWIRLRSGQRDTNRNRTMYGAPNAVEELKCPRKRPPKEKVEAITDALKYFEVI